MDYGIPTPYQYALRYVGIRELAGRKKNHPWIQWCLMLCGYDADSPDEIPWCSAFVNGIVWPFPLPRTKSARARSWLGVGYPIDIEECRPGFDLVVLNRGGSPDPAVLEGPGHVGFFSSWQPQRERVLLLGGNQSNSVSIAAYSTQDLLGCVRLVRPA